MTQTAFGKRIGLTKGAVTNYERGDNEPSGDTMLRIAAEFPGLPPIPVPTSNGQESSVMLPNGHRAGGNVTQNVETLMVVKRLDSLPRGVRYEAALAALNAIEKVVKDPQQPAAAPQESHRDRHS